MWALFHDYRNIPHRRLSRFAQIVERLISGLRPYPGNARTHSKKQLKQIAASISRFGFTNPVLVSDDGEIIAGQRQGRGSQVARLEVGADNRAGPSLRR